MTRPTWHDTWAAVARTVAERATCCRRKVGCVIVGPDQRILATGYNGAPSGVVHCIDRPDGCVLEDGHCAYSVHAEANAIVQAAASRGGLTGSMLYVTWPPCSRCALLIAQAGVQEVVIVGEWELPGPVALDVFHQRGIRWAVWMGLEEEAA